MTTLRKLLALLGIALIMCVASNKESFGQSQSLTAFYTAPVVSMSPMWIAKEAGFFKKQGLDVKLVFIASGPVGTASVLGGETDVGIIGGFAPIRALVGGAKGLVIIGQSKNRMTGNIVGKKEIASVQDLKGKRLGIDRIGSESGHVRSSRPFPVFRSILSRIFNTFSSAILAKQSPPSRRAPSTPLSRERPTIFLLSDSASR